MNSFLKIICIFTCVVVLVQAGFYFTERIALQKSNKKDYFSDSTYQVYLADIKQAYQKPNVTGAFSNQKKGSAVHALQPCSFTSSSTPLLSPVLLQEIAWMGSEKSAHDEWIRLKKNVAGNVDVSGWWMVTESGSFTIALRPGTMMSDLEPALLFERGVHYTGSLRNSDEGIRLFDANCSLIDEVFARSRWPAGDNEKKITMKRGVDLRWFDDDALDASSSTIPLESSSSSVSSVASSSKDVVSNTSTDNSAHSIEENPAADAVKSNHEISRVNIVAFMAGSELDAQQEYIVIRNNGSDLVDLSGWTLKKKASSGVEYTLVSAKAFSGALAGHAEFTIAHREYPDAADLRYSNNSNSLAYENNSIVLIDAQGRIVDEVAYVSVQKGEVWRR